MPQKTMTDAKIFDFDCFSEDLQTKEMKRVNDGQGRKITNDAVPTYMLNSNRKKSSWAPPLHAIIVDFMTDINIFYVPS